MKPWQLKGEENSMKMIEGLLTLFAFFWILVFAFGFPFPVSWLILANVTLIFMIVITVEELKGGK